MLPPRSSWLALLIAALVITGVTMILLNLDKSKKPAPDTTAKADTAATDTLAQKEPEYTTPVVPVNTVEDQPGDFVLVAGSFKSETYADEFKKKIESEMSTSLTVIPVRVDSVQYYRVIMLRGVSQQSALDGKQRLERAGFTEGWVYKRKI